MRYFEDVKVGDAVFAFPLGWCKVTKVNEFEFIVHNENNPIYISLNKDGELVAGSGIQTAFWDEPKIEIPPRPLPDLNVDDKVLVWDNKDTVRCKRYFSHFKDGIIHCFNDGLTSWSAYDNATTPWDNFEVVK